MNFSLGASIVLHRSQSRSFRRLLLTLAIGGSAVPSLAVEPSELHLRAPMQSKLQIRSTHRPWLGEERLAKSSRPATDTAQPKAADGKSGATGQDTATTPFAEINDGWVAREAINQVVPLRDPLSKGIGKGTSPDSTAGPDGIAESPAAEPDPNWSPRGNAAPENTDPPPAVLANSPTNKKDQSQPEPASASPRLAKRPDVDQPQADAEPQESAGDMKLMPADPPSLGQVSDSGWEPRIAALPQSQNEASTEADAGPSEPDRLTASGDSASGDTAKDDAADPGDDLDPDAATVDRRPDQREIASEDGTGNGAEPESGVQDGEPSSAQGLSEASDPAAVSPDEASAVDEAKSAMSAEQKSEPSGEGEAGEPGLENGGRSGSGPITARLDDQSKTRQEDLVKPENAGAGNTGAAESGREPEDSVGQKTQTPSESRSVEEVVVRPLRILRDGRIANAERREVDNDLQEPRRQRGSETNRDTADAESRRSIAAEPQSIVLDYTGRKAERIQLSNSISRMQPMMRRCLQHYYLRPETAQERSNWGMLHAIMVYGVDTKILARNRAYSAIAWMAGNNICRGKRMFEEGPNGIRATNGIGLQGHQGQFLAIMGMVGVPIDYSLYVGGDQYSVEDLVRSEASLCKSGEELTFTLIGLSHYLNTDDAWTDARGERWDFERLIREELSQPVIGAACGGTHRLMGLAHALRKRRAERRPITGQWARAETFLNDFVEYSYTLQNRDGSMSTNWFEGRGNDNDLDRKVQTTGHIVEWLLTVTPDSQLQDPRLVRAIRFLLNAMYGQRNRDWAIGPKGHALRSLAMYYERVYSDGTAWEDQAVTRTRSRSRR